MSPVPEKSSCEKVIVKTAIVIHLLRARILNFYKAYILQITTNLTIVIKIARVGGQPLKRTQPLLRVTLLHFLLIQ